MQLKYSVDKIKYSIPGIDVSGLQYVMCVLGSMSEVDREWTSRKVVECQYNYNICIGDGVLYFGVNPNYVKANMLDNKYKTVVLEYNPNKVNLKQFPLIYNLIESRFNLAKVSSFDIAVDIFEPFCNFKMLKRDAREYFCYIGNHDLETQYLGSTKKNGHVKLYNKAKEQKQLSDSWTRFEITIKEIKSLSPTIDSFKKAVNLPLLYRVGKQLTFDDVQLKPSERHLLDYYILYPEKLSEITKYQRNKYINLINKQLDSVEISVPEMYYTYIDYTKQLLMQ